MKSLILTVLVSAACLETGQGQVPQIIAFQGTVTVGGTNYQGTGLFKFALVSGDGASTYWSNDGSGGEPRNAVILPVVDGAYEVQLGDPQEGMVPITPSIFENSDVRVRVWFSTGSSVGSQPFQILQPDTRITAVGYAMMAANVADGAVTSTKIADGAITAGKIADNAVTAANLAPGAVAAGQLAPGAAAANLQASGGLILSDQSNATNLVQAGFQSIGTVIVNGDQWQSLSRFTPAPRYGHVAVWTGQEMIIWGGSVLGGSASTGARYNPATDIWTTITNRNAIAANKAVWTGTQMIVLGNLVGAVYNPASDTWQRISMVNGPTNINSQTLIWTGRELLAWGGLGAGGRYDPAANVWTLMSTIGSPSARAGHTAVWAGSEMIIWGGQVQVPTGTGAALNSGARYNPSTDTWTPINANLPPSARFGHTAVWSGTEMLVWGGYANRTPLFTDTGVAYDPTTDAWRKLPKVGEPAPRSYHVAFWTGSEMIVWGGQDPLSVYTYLNSGGAFDPVAGTWRALPLKAGPEAVASSFTGSASAVWTGSEMIIWGGQVSPYSGNFTLSNSGSRYRPDRDEWIPMLGSIGRTGHTAVWTGTEVIIWGGSQTVNSNPSGFLRSGARFNPVTRSWTPISTDGAPSARQNHQAVWTGTEMIVWGGEGYSTNGPYGRQYSFSALNSGGRYNPAADTWTPMETDVAPTARSGHSMVWTGSEALMFGGRTFNNENQYTYLDSGASYNPVTDSWEALSHPQAPSPRYLHTALWTGQEMISWGGLVSTNQTTLLSPVNTGASYNPVLERWTPLPTNGAPRITRLSAAVWTGDNMIVVTGWASSRAARYNPASDGWSPISGAGAPLASQPATSMSIPSIALVWTGKEVLVWGTMTPTSGTRYNPLTDTWTPMTTAGAPKARSGHTAIWTGDSMVIVGGLETGGTLPDTTLIYQLTRPLYLYGKH